MYLNIDNKKGVHNKCNIDHFSNFLRQKVEMIFMN